MSERISAEKLAEELWEAYRAQPREGRIPPRWEDCTTGMREDMRAEARRALELIPDATEWKRIANNYKTSAELFQRLLKEAKATPAGPTAAERELMRAALGFDRTSAGFRSDVGGGSVACVESWLNALTEAAAAVRAERQPKGPRFTIGAIPREDCWIVCDRHAPDTSGANHEYVRVQRADTAQKVCDLLNAAHERGELK